MPRPPRFDITRVRLRHYRSIPRCDVRPGDLTFLVGPNGSGKSNFLDSLRLVSQALDENLDNALRERGGATEVRRRSTGHPTHFSISLEFRGDDFRGLYEFSIGAVGGGNWRVTGERCEVEGVQFDTGPAKFVVRDGQVVDSSLGVALPPAPPDRLYLVVASAFTEFRPVFDGLNVFSLSPDAMRRVQKPDTGDLLRRDGSNIASVLERLRREHPKAKSVIEDYLRLVVPGMESADRLEVGAWESVQFRQRVRGAEKPWLFPATSVSDGTLRALGVLVALFAPSDGGYTPIGIEEPETGLHPAATGVLLDALQAASKTRQVLVTSHNPDLLDTSSIGIDSLLAVRADAGDTHIGPVDGPTARATDRQPLHTRRIAADRPAATGQRGRDAGSRPVNGLPRIGAVVEGHGEVQAVPVLVRRIALEIYGRPIDVRPPHRLPRSKICTPAELERALRLQVARVGRDGGVLVVFDADDEPATVAASVASIARTTREGGYCGCGQGVRGLVPGCAAIPGQPSGREARRRLRPRPGSPPNCKKELELLMTESYSEMRHQAAFAAVMDLTLARRNSPSFEGLVAAVGGILGADAP